MQSQLRAYRRKQGWSQAELARWLEVSRQTISSIENNKYDPSLRLAFRIAGLFGTSIEAMFLRDTIETDRRYKPPPRRENSA